MKPLLLLSLLSMQILVKAQTEIPLYEKEIPNARRVPNKEYTETAPNNILRVHSISIPTLTIFEAPKNKANGAAVIVIPGGGYSIVAMSHEGYDVAKRFNEMGVTAFVLKYRIPSDSTMLDKTIGPLQDAQRAIQYVREHSRKWKLDKNRLGVLGFSAGGHLAATAGTHFKKAVIANPKNTSLRPDFMILVYPVISFNDSLMHQGSRDNLLGKNANPKLIENYSNELQVRKNTPPTFLVHAKDDNGVKVENSLRFYDALQKNGVPAGIYLYEKGGHGFGMNNLSSTVKWMDLVQEWLKAGNWFFPKGN